MVYNCRSLYAIHNSSTSSRLLDKEKSVLQDLPDYAADHGRCICDNTYPDGQVFKTHESHGSSDPTRSTGCRAHIYLQKSDVKKVQGRLVGGAFPNFFTDQPTTRRTIQAASRRFIPRKVSVQLWAHLWLQLFLAQVLHQLEDVLRNPQTADLHQLWDTL